MSVTTEAKRKPTTERAKNTAEAASSPMTARDAIAPPPKLRRRPLLVVASIAAVCLGALFGVWAYTSVSTAQEVVAVRSSVQRGALISREDLVTVRIGVDPALSPIPATELDGVVGQRAAMDLPAGGLVTRDSIASTVVPAQDMSVVGVALPAALLPGEPLRAGDQVRVVATPGQQGEVDRWRAAVHHRHRGRDLPGRRQRPDSGQRPGALRPGGGAGGARCDRQGRLGAGLPGALTRMAVIVLASASGSPGVTTSALGLALTWPRPVLLVEADPTGGSAVLAGYFRGLSAHTTGLIDLAWAHREGLLEDALAELPMPIPDSSASLLPGVRAHTQARSLAALWEPLAAALKRLDRTGRDVIIDAGRLGLTGSPEPLIYGADLMLLVMRSDLVALAAARSWAETLRAGFDELGTPAQVRALLVGECRPYSGRDVAKVLGLPVAAALAWDEASAAVFSRGASPPRRFLGRALPRSLTARRGPPSNPPSRPTLPSSLRPA